MKTIFILLVIGVTHLTSADYPGLFKLESLGRSARIGTLYDALTETFTSTSILSGNVSSHLISKMGTPSVHTKMGLTRSYTEKRTQMDITLTATLSALMGLIKVSGSATFLHEEQKKVNSVVGSLTYNCLTSEEILEIFYDETMSQISKSTLENLKTSPYTYVIIGIAWGANVVVKFEDYNEENVDINRLSGSMSFMLNSLGNGVQSEDVETITNFTMNVFGDLALEDEDLPTNLNEVMTLVQNVPRLIAQTPEGKGKELFFYMVPLEKIKQRVLHTPGIMGPENNLKMPQLLDDDINSQVELFEQIQIIRLKLNDLSSRINNNRNILNNTDLHNIKYLQSSFTNSVQNYRQDLKQGVLNFRRGRSGFKNGGQVLKQIEQKFRQSLFSLQGTEDAVDNDFKDVKLKIDIVQFLKGQGSVWVGRGESSDLNVVRLLRKMGVQISVCAIHFRREYLKNTLLFLQTLDQAHKEGYVPLVVDCDFFNEGCDQNVGDMTCEPIYTPNLLTEVSDYTKPFAKIRKSLIDIILNDNKLVQEIQKLNEN